MIVRRCTWEHLRDAYTLLAEEVADLNALALLDDVDVNGEMGVHQPHLVLKALVHKVTQAVSAQKIIHRAAML